MSLNCMHIKRDRAREGEDIHESVTNLCVLQNAHNKTYLSMLDNALKMESYYYSTNYDLTHSFQRLYNTSPDFHSMSLLERVNKAHLIYMYFIFYKYLHLILNGFIHFGHSLSVHCKHIIFGCIFFFLFGFGGKCIPFFSRSVS